MKLRAVIPFTILTSLGAVASPVGIATSPDGSKLFIGMERPAAVLVVDRSAAKITASWPMPAALRALTISPDGATLIAPVGIAPGKILSINTSDGTVTDSIAAGHSPRSATLSADGNRLFVCNQFENQVDVFDRMEKRKTGSFPVIREPVASVLRPDGKALFVANLLPAGAANTGNIAAEISVIDCNSGLAASIRLPNGSTDARALTSSPDGRFIYVVHTLARYALPTTQLDRGWMNTSALSVIDANRSSLIATVLLDDIDLGAANPAGIACSADGKLIAVAHAGTHELSLIDRNAMHERIEGAGRGEQVTSASKSIKDIANDLSFLYGIRKRVKLAGNGPRTVVATPGGFAVACYFSRTLHLVTAGAELTSTVRDITLGPADDDPARRGERMFHDATRCFQHWQSCATCHPGVRTDALNWDLLNDGVGNPKQTKSLLFSLQTPPAMISGIRPDVSGVHSGASRFWRRYHRCHSLAPYDIYE